MATPTTEQDQKRRSFHTLDGIRGVAALAVLSLHTPNGGALPLPARHLAVDLFFVISGFVISYSYGQRLRGGLTPLQFMGQRLSRLAPLYIAGTLICAAVYFLFSRSHPPLWMLPLALFFVPTPYAAAPKAPDFLFPFNMPGWSLLYELLVNVVFALTTRWLSRTVLWTVLVVSAGGLVAVAIKRHGLDVGWQWSSKAGGVFRVTYSFFAGVGLHWAWQQGVRVPRLSSPALVVAPLALFAVPLSSTVADPILVIGAFPLLILAAVSSEPKTRWAVTACVVLGEISYPVYALQAGGTVWLEMQPIRQWLPEIAVWMMVVVGSYYAYRMDLKLRRKLLSYLPSALGGRL